MAQPSRPPILRISQDSGVIELYHHGSSVCAAKVRFALHERGWSGAATISISSRASSSIRAIKINPKGVVPTLVHDGKVIPESTVICEYVEETFADRPILPATPYERTRVRIWTKAVDEELHPACSAITYVVSHRHTILRNGVGGFEDFVKQGGAEGIGARTLKWQWLQHGLAAPGAADKIRLYAGYLRMMENALGDSPWLVGNTFSMADIAMTPYVNRLDALAMSGLWQDGRLPGSNAGSNG